jgi:CubicO group peptidase (beta-lactamase class C family)
MKTIFKKYIKKIITIFTLLVFPICRAEHKEENQSDIVTLKSGSHFNLSKNLRIVKEDSFTKITTVENDVTIYFLELPYTDNLKFDELSSLAWEKSGVPIDYKIKSEFAPPSINAWESIYTIIYEVPSKEFKNVNTLIRVYQGKAYINLISGSVAGMDRRGAEINEAIASWQPMNFVSENLTTVQPRKWNDNDYAEFEKFINSSMEKLKIPGIAVALINNNNEVYVKGFGVKKIGSSDLITKDTLFRIASITKPLTTLMMAKLIEQKKIKWSTEVTTLLKDFQFADAEFSKKLNLKQTVSASTGMPRRDFEFMFKFKNVSAEQRLKDMSDTRPTTAFGETFQYSNFLVALGGYAAARSVNKKDDLKTAFTLVMEKMVFKPLAMNNSFIDHEIVKNIGAASPHVQDFYDETKEISPSLELGVYSVAPAGAIWSTVSDLAKYVVMELNKGISAEGVKYIDEGFLLERRKPGIKSGDKSYYGLGLSIGEDYNLTRIGHDGGIQGFVSSLSFFPDKGFGLVILSNSGRGGPILRPIKEKFFEITFNVKEKSQKMIDFAVAVNKESVAKQQAIISIDSKKNKWIDQLTGFDFTNDKLGTIKINKKNNIYFMDIGDFKEVEVGGITESNGDHLLGIISPPWTGLQILLQNNGQELLLDGGQYKYIFKKELF